MRPLAIAVLLSLTVEGCAAPRKKPDIALTPPSALCGDNALRPKGFCLPAGMENRLKLDPIKVLFVEDATSGTTGVRVVYARLGDKDVVRLKWKIAKPGGEGLNNQPRKEIAAVAVQNLILDDDEVVIPPTVLRCVPLEDHKAVEDTPPTFERTSCVVAMISYWLENMTTVGKLDEARWEADVAYRATIAKMNLLAYLIDHRDTRKANFLISKERDHPRAFSIDNSLSFSGFQNPKVVLFPMWKEIKVPALPRRAVERLRKLQRVDLDRLATVVQFTVGPQGHLKEVDPAPPLDADKGVRRDGDVIQFGLTKDEIDGVETRLRDLLKEIDEGKVQVF